MTYNVANSYYTALLLNRQLYKKKNSTKCSFFRELGRYPLCIRPWMLTDKTRPIHPRTWASWWRGMYPHHAAVLGTMLSVPHCTAFPRNMLEGRSHISLQVIRVCFFVTYSYILPSFSIPSPLGWGGAWNLFWWPQHVPLALINPTFPWGSL